MAGSNGPRDIIRCPECESGVLITPSFVARTSTVKRFSLPLRVCRRCKVILIHERAWVAEWKIWNKREYIGRID